MHHAATPHPHQVQDACGAALASHKAYAFLVAYLRAMPGDHPRHAAVADTVELVHAEWLDHVGAVSRLCATSQAELLLKAAVISRLIERDKHDDVVGGPALILAASLADDILARP